MLGNGTRKRRTKPFALKIFNLAYRAHPSTSPFCIPEPLLTAPFGSYLLVKKTDLLVKKVKKMFTQQHHRLAMRC